MTDTTAFTAQMGCLLFGVLSLRERRHSGACLALSLALGLFAYTVREAALAAPLAVLAGWFVAYPGSKARRRSILLLALARLRRRFLRLAAQPAWGRGTVAHRRCFLLHTGRGAPARVLHRGVCGSRRHFSSCWRRGGAPRLLVGRRPRPSRLSFLARSWRFEAGADCSRSSRETH